MKLLSLLLAILVIVPLVIAIPEIPHQFYGTISNDNGLVDSGTLKAVLNDKEFTAQITDGNYGLNDPFLIHREDSSETNIEFYVDDNKVYDFTYESGAYTELNLDIPVFTTQDNNPTPTGNSNSNSVSNNNVDENDAIVVPSEIPQDNSNNQQASNNKEPEEVQSESFFSSLKSITGNVIEIPFKTTQSSIISSFVIAFLIITVFLYALTGKNLIFRPKKTIRRARRKIRNLFSRSI